MNKYKNAFTEVNTILEYLEEEEYEKIPKEVLDAINENRNTKYQYKINEELDLKKQPMLPETRAILFNIFRDYLSTPEQKEKIIKMQEEERQQNELKKQQTYKIEVFAKKKKEANKKDQKENLELVQYRENIFKKIFKWLKIFFHHSD